MSGKSPASSKHSPRSNFKNLPDYVLYDLIDRMDMDTLVRIWKADRFMRGRINKLGESQLKQLVKRGITNKRYLSAMVCEYNFLPALLLLLLDENPPVISDADDWNQGMREAARGNNKKLVDWFIKKGADNWEWGMQGAAQGGHLELVKWFIQKIDEPDTVIYIWNGGLHSAAEGGHKKLIDWFIKKGADDWDAGMYGAAEGGHFDLVKYFIEKGADDWDSGLVSSVFGDQLDLVKWFVEKKNANNLNEALEMAAYGGRLDIVKYLVKKGADDWDRGIEVATEGGHQYIVYYLQKMKAK